MRRSGGGPDRERTDRAYNGKGDVTARPDLPEAYEMRRQKTGGAIRKDQSGGDQEVQDPD